MIIYTFVLIFTSHVVNLRLITCAVLVPLTWLAVGQTKFVYIHIHAFYSMRKDVKGKGKRGNKWRTLRLYILKGKKGNELSDLQ